MEIILLIWMLFGVAAMVVMQNEVRSGYGGFALGFLFGPIWLIITYVLSWNQHTMEKREMANGSMRKCPQCAELIPAEARKCRFCGSDV